MKAYIARDANGNLFAHRKKPRLTSTKTWVSMDEWQLFRKDFPEVTFENSPMEVELVIKK